MPDNMMPLVCICIPIYNAEATIKETLTSIINQSYRNLVINLIDNASTDRTMEIIQTFNDPRIHIHRNDTNIGGEKNFDRCIELAQGKYTAIYHADDVYESQMVEKQVAFLEGNLEAGAVFTGASQIDEGGIIIGNIQLPRSVGSTSNLYDFSDVFKVILKHSNVLICPSAMVRTDVYQRDVQCFRWELFGSSADLDAWLRILQSYPVGILPESLMRSRVSASQWTASVRLEVARADFFRVIDYYLGQDQVKTFLNPNDFRNYAKLERRDMVARSINLFLTDRPEEAKKLCRIVFSLDAITSAFQSKRGLITLIIGLYIQLLVLTGINKAGKISLAYMKRATHK